jgi:hypothetical protein
MPTVGGKKFPYTKAGKAAAAKAKSKTAGKSKPSSFDLFLAKVTGKKKSAPKKK